MWSLARIAAGLAALPATGVALLLLASLLDGRPDWMSFCCGAMAAALAFLGWWLAGLGHRPEWRARFLWAAVGGVVVGAFALAAGFAGPLILTPDANQGPLLGIFFTGPLGFAVGVAAGTAFGIARVPRARARGRSVRRARAGAR